MVRIPEGKGYNFFPDPADWHRGPTHPPVQDLGGTV